MPAQTSRRDMLVGSLCAVTALYSRDAAQAQTCKQPSITDPGPFFPIGDVPERWSLISPVGTVTGQALYVSGTVRDQHCTPLHGATVIAWQADSNGRYNHPLAENHGPLDPHFFYFGRQLTNAVGGYRLSTIVPAPYQFRGLHRAPHIHFLFSFRAANRLVTELYFDRPDDVRRREGDRVWASRDVATRNNMIIALNTSHEVGAPPGALWGSYDVTLPA